jgi:hypothetical protein
MFTAQGTTDRIDYNSFVASNGATAMLNKSIRTHNARPPARVTSARDGLNERVAFRPGSLHPVAKTVEAPAPYGRSDRSTSLPPDGKRCLRRSTVAPPRLVIELVARPPMAGGGARERGSAVSALEAERRRRGSNRPVGQTLKREEPEDADADGQQDDLHVPRLRAGDEALVTWGGIGDAVHQLESTRLARVGCAQELHKSCASVYPSIRLFVYPRCRDVAMSRFAYRDRASRAPAARSARP